MRKFVLLIAGTLLIAACSKQPESDKSSNVLLDSQRAALEKAKQTEKIVMDAAERQRKELEKEQQ